MFDRSGRRDYPVLRRFFSWLAAVRRRPFAANLLTDILYGGSGIPRHSCLAADQPEKHSTPMRERKLNACQCRPPSLGSRRSAKLTDPPATPRLALIDVQGPRPLHKQVYVRGLLPKALARRLKDGLLGAEARKVGMT